MNRLFTRPLFLLFLGLLFSPLSNSARAQEVHRYINVTGTADVKVAPDEVVINLASTQRTRTFATRSRKMTRGSKTDRRPRKAGIDPKHIQPGLIRVTPNHEDAQQQYGKGASIRSSMMQMPAQPARVSTPRMPPRMLTPFRSTSGREQRTADQRLHGVEIGCRL